MAEGKTSQSLGYVWQKLHQSTDSLVTGLGPIKNRLEYAVAACAPLVAHEDHFSESVRRKYDEIRELHYEAGTPAASIAAADDVKASKLAKLYWELYDEVRGMMIRDGNDWV